MAEASFPSCIRFLRLEPKIFRSPLVHLDMKPRPCRVNSYKHRAMDRIPSPPIGATCLVTHY